MIYNGNDCLDVRGMAAEDVARRLRAANCDSTFALDGAAELAKFSGLWPPSGYDPVQWPFTYIWAHELCARIARVVTVRTGEEPKIHHVPPLPSVDYNAILKTDSAEVALGCAVVFNFGRTSLAITYDRKLIAVQCEVPDEEWASHPRRVALVADIDKLA